MRFCPESLGRGAESVGPGARSIGLGAKSMGCGAEKSGRFAGNYGKARMATQLVPQGNKELCRAGNTHSATVADLPVGIPKPCEV